MATSDQMTGRPDAGAAVTGARPSLWPAGLVAAAVAAVATTTIAAVARALDVPLALDGRPISLAAFPTFTVLGAVAGILLALAVTRWTGRPRRTFTLLTLGLTVLSLVPDLLVHVSTGSRLVLMLTHLVAASIVIPTLRRRLPE